MIGLTFKKQRGLNCVCMEDTKLCFIMLSTV